jgi:hypothetical protein
MSTEPQQPAGDNRDQWQAYWTAQGMPWRTEPEIDAKRQALLDAKRRIAASPENGRYSFTGVKLTRADVEWLLATHQSDGLTGPVFLDDERQRLRRGIDLRDANVSGNVNLSHLPLARAQFGTSLSAESLVEGGKESRWGLSLCAVILLLAVEFLIAIPTGRISGIAFDPWGYWLVTIGAMYALGFISLPLLIAVRRWRIPFVVKWVDYFVLAVAAAGMLIICEFAVAVLSISTDAHGFEVGSAVVLVIALVAAGLYFPYRLWRARTLYARERRYRLIRQSGPICQDAYWKAHILRKRFSAARFSGEES